MNTRSVTPSQATIEEDGRTILQDIAVRVCESDSAPIGQQWFGSFDLPSDATLREGGRYRLILADGRSGDILIENTEVAADSDEHEGRLLVGFMGVGVLQGSAQAAEGEDSPDSGSASRESTRSRNSRSQSRRSRDRNSSANP